MTLTLASGPMAMVLGSMSRPRPWAQGNFYDLDFGLGTYGHGLGLDVQA